MAENRDDGIPRHGLDDEVVKICVDGIQRDSAILSEAQSLVETHARGVDRHDVKPLFNQPYSVASLPLAEAQDLALRKKVRCRNQEIVRLGAEGVLGAVVSFVPHGVALLRRSLQKLAHGAESHGPGDSKSELTVNE